MFNIHANIKNEDINKIHDISIDIIKVHLTF